MSKENKLLIMIKSNCLLLMTSQQQIINYETTNFSWRIQLPSASLSRFRALNSMKVTKVPSKYLPILFIFGFVSTFPIGILSEMQKAVEFFKINNKISWTLADTMYILCHGKPKLLYSSKFYWACKVMKVCIVQNSNLLWVPKLKVP